jgi:hypothetical protein
MRSVIVKRLALLAVLGCLTSIGVSWGIALRTDLRGAPRPPQSGASFRYENDNATQVWIFNQQRMTGAIQISCAPAGPVIQDGRANPAQAFNHAQDSDVPSWSMMRLASHPAASNFIEQGFGWPMLASYQRFEGDYNSSARWKRVLGISVQPALKQLGPGAALPYGMIFPGLAVNAVIYAWFWFALLSFPILVRTILRRRRGACRKCGYDLRATTGACPECGARS